VSWRNRIRKPFIKEHRRQQLDKAMELILNGFDATNYMALRAKKLKEISHTN